MKNCKCLVVDFVQAAQINGLVNIWAYLPKSHHLIKNNKVGQIRKVRDALAYGFDELGNRVRMTPDCLVVQDL